MGLDIRGTLKRGRGVFHRNSSEGGGGVQRARRGGEGVQKRLCLIGGHLRNVLLRVCRSNFPQEQNAPQTPSLCNFPICRHFSHFCVERKIEHKFFFLKLFGHLRDIPAKKSRDIPPKKFGFPGFEGHAELFGPQPFTWKSPTPPENIGPESLGLGSFFLPDLEPLKNIVLYSHECEYRPRMYHRRRMNYISNSSGNSAGIM